MTASWALTAVGCHTTRNFIDRSDEIRTHQSTRFPLTGAHLLLPCEDCHRSESRGGLVFVGTPIDCVDCHESDFTRTTSPDHVASGLDRDCTLCHSSLSWRSGQFDHNASGFPLTGAHAPLQCSDCHRGNQFSGQSTDCFSCHQQDFETAANPNHSASGFSTSCADCHSSQAWRPASFDHAQTSFPLTGAHSRLDCQQCHTGGATGPLPGDCFSCHQQDFETAANPNHSASGFSTSCADCHSSQAWRPASFDHAQTSFPLTGAHNSLDCQQCHTGGATGPLAMECIACHDTDYQQAPGHVSSNFPTTCEDCHSTVSWAQGVVDHSSFPLTGGHSGLSCQQCHTSGTFTAIPADCASCHMDDYQRAPDHTALNFPLDCESCHKITSWSAVSFFHSFPLRGHHDRRCTDCHLEGTTQTFSCSGTCHQHTQSKMDRKHRGVSGYIYEFQACLSCHPDGRN
ncbi:MAG: cytochrome c3 family protein [Acidobacteriota bacterium]